jgi:hypothetical protein
MKFTFAPESRPLEGYTIKRAIYRGGFGEVYYALTDAGREVALKLLQNNTEIELRGVKQCLNLSHPNLVTIFDVKQDADGDHWILMEYIGGDTLDVAIRRHPTGMPMQEVRRWLPGLAAGVSFLHDRGIVHRDLKPGNIFIENGVVKVGDVGLSKFITPSRRSAQTQSVGTVYYMAPEVAKGKYGKEVDVYALGIILYEMLTGRVPFEGESTGEILMKHLSEPPDVSVLPPRLQPVIARALEKDPARRYASISELADAFERAVLGRRPVLDIPEASFQTNKTPPSVNTILTAEQVVASPVQKPAHSGRMPWPRTNADAWMLGGLIALCLTPFVGMPFMGIAAIAAIAYGAFGLARESAKPSATERPVVVAQHGVPNARGAGPVDKCHRRGVSPAARRHGNGAMTPHTPRTLTLRTRIADFTGSAVVAAMLTALLTTGVAVVSPEFFANGHGSETLDPAAIGLFAATAVLASWSIMGGVKLLEGRRVAGGERRLILLALGCLVGGGAWGLNEVLMVSLPSDGNAVFANVGSHSLMSSLGPSWIGYVVFFGLLFSLRRWWWHADRFRPSRFRLSSLLLTMMLAWLLSAVWEFPHTWAVVWAAVISSVVQIASVWTPPESRTTHIDH